MCKHCVKAVSEGKYVSPLKLKNVVSTGGVYIYIHTHIHTHTHTHTHTQTEAAQRITFPPYPDSVKVKIRSDYRISFVSMSS
jgi:hypothetical protein